MLPMSRRHFLKAAGIGVTAAAILPGGRALALPDPRHRFVSVAFFGGWDILLGPDARDPSRSFGPEMNLGTSLLDAAYQTPRSVHIGGQEALWGAPIASLEQHADVLTLFLGVNMNTVAHSTGQAYGNTFIQPSGSTARGDSLGVRASSLNLGAGLVLPSVSIGLPAYNVSFGSELSGLGVGQAADLQGLLSPSSAALSSTTTALLRTAQQGSESCIAAGGSGDSLVAAIAQSRTRSDALLARNLSTMLNLAEQPAVVARYGIANVNAAGDPAVRAAIVSQIFAADLTRSVSFRLSENLDTHSGWATLQPTRLERATRALARLISDLRETDPMFERTTVVVHSDFSRTPRINGTQGRDHWFANAFFVFGGRLKRGVCGSTVPETLGLRAIDPVSGAPSESGIVLRPEHVGATLSHALGADTASFRVDPLTAWIGGQS